MAQIKKSFGKDPSDWDTVLDAILQDIENHNAKDAKLVAFSIQPGDVILFYEEPLSANVNKTLPRQ
jgi:hypothetical protein